MIVFKNRKTENQLKIIDDGIKSSLVNNFQKIRFSSCFFSICVAGSFGSHVRYGALRRSSMAVFCSLSFCHLQFSRFFLSIRFDAYFISVFRFFRCFVSVFSVRGVPLPFVFTVFYVSFIFSSLRIPLLQTVGGNGDKKNRLLILLLNLFVFGNCCTMLHSIRLAKHTEARHQLRGYFNL